MGQDHVTQGVPLATGFLCGLQQLGQLRQFLDY